MKILHIPTAIEYNWLGSENQIRFQITSDTEWVWISGLGAFFREQYDIDNWEIDDKYRPEIAFRKYEFCVVEE